jgi:hypothetical protein
MLARVIPFPLRAAPVVEAEEKTVVVRNARGGLSWAAIARDIASARKPSPVPAPVHVPVAAPQKASKARKAPPPVWAKLEDRWGLDALVDRKHESAARIRSMPARVGQLLKLPEWASSTVDMTTEAGEVMRWGHIEHLSAIASGLYRAKGPQPVSGPVPPPTVREWIVITHASGAVMRLDPTKIAM